MKKLIIIFLILLGACYSQDDETADCPDSRFIGDWVNFYYWVASDGINEICEYESYGFEDSDEGFYYIDIRNYNKSSGWYFFQDDYLFEWDVSGNYVFINGSSMTFEFSGNSLFLDGIEYVKE